MEIRKKLAYQFIGIVAFILWFTLVVVYFLFSQARKEEFYNRLSSKAIMVAQMLIDIDEIDLELLKRIERNNPLNLANEKIIIYDYNNNKIYSTDNDNIIKIPENNIDQIRVNQSMRFSQKPYEIVGEFYVGQYDRIVVFAAATDIFGMNKLKWLRIIMVVVFFISLVIVFLAGRLFSIRALHPISLIVRQVNTIGISNLNARVNEGNGKDEMALLAKTFNKMLGRLETAFKTQKSFIANASHELRTPLTVITGQIEVILMKARTNEEYRKILQLVLAEIKDLNQISNKLLLLAQASSDPADISFSLFRIDDLLWQAQNDLQTRNPEYILNIRFDKTINDEGKMLVTGNASLMKTAILNLMENACKYSNGLPVEVILAFQNNLVIIHFIDKGIGIEKSDIKTIFEPFYRSKNAMNHPGHGIGLSLAEKIALLHKGKIEVKSESGKGSEFILMIPVTTKN